MQNRHLLTGKGCVDGEDKIEKRCINSSSLPLIVAIRRVTREKDLTYIRPLPFIQVFVISCIKFIAF
jgi:hypothetical protein